jgi:hypothetical protein
VNQRTGAASLDYASHKDIGLRVIAVGGNSLSRGLTLEGLSTSYFYRNSQMYDTLLQMGRWFGYRDDYADLCRLWLADEAAQWYAHITLATEELRYEFKKMWRKNATPREFGLKVRAHPDSLIVTAQNKMRLAHTIERVISISNESLESTRLKTNKKVISANKQAVLAFIQQLGKEGFSVASSEWKNPIWRNIPRELVVSLLRNFQVHPLNIAFQTDDLADYFARATERKLQLWDDIEDRYRNIGKSVPDREYRERREKPLLLIHLISPYLKNDDRELPFDTGSDELIALGLSMPMFDDSDVAKKVKYRVNLVEWRAMLEEAVDDDLPEDGDGG